MNRHTKYRGEVLDGTAANFLAETVKAKESDNFKVCKEKKPVNLEYYT